METCYHICHTSDCFTTDYSPYSFFTIPNSLTLFLAKWSAGEILNYYSSVLATIGTILVSAVAIRQTSKLVKEERKLQKEKERRHIEDIKPMLELKYLKHEHISGTPYVIDPPMINVKLRILIENKSTNEMINPEITKIIYSTESFPEEKLKVSNLPTPFKGNIIIETSDFWLHSRQPGFVALEAKYSDYERRQYNLIAGAIYMPENFNNWQLTRFDVIPQFTIDE